MKLQRPSYIFGGISICIGLLLWFQLHRYYPKAVAQLEVSQLTTAQVHSQTAQLEKQIIPPDGTPLREVEAIYGKASVSPPPHFGEGIPETLYCVHLLPPQDHSDFRAMLIMHLAKRRTFRNSINHVCVLNNRRQVDIRSKQAIRGLQAALDAEDRGVLVDLLQIQHRYASGIENAAWNHLPFQSAS